MNPVAVRNWSGVGMKAERPDGPVFSIYGWTLFLQNSMPLHFGFCMDTTVETSRNHKSTSLHQSTAVWFTGVPVHTFIILELSSFLHAPAACRIPCVVTAPGFLHNAATSWENLGPPLNLLAFTSLTVNGNDSSSFSHSFTSWLWGCSEKPDLK